MRSSIVAGLLVAALARVVHAGAAGVVVTGEDSIQAPLAAQLDGWLRAHGYETVASPLPPEAINAMADCFVIADPKCAQKVVEGQAQVEAILYARVTAVTNGTSRDLTLILNWFVKGKDPAEERRVCQSCTDEMF